jgi:hypothetical protein
MHAAATFPTQFTGTGMRAISLDDQDAYPRALFEHAVVVVIQKNLLVCGVNDHGVDSAAPPAARAAPSAPFSSKSGAWMSDTTSEAWLSASLHDACGRATPPAGAQR